MGFHFEGFCGMILLEYVPINRQMGEIMKQLRILHRVLVRTKAIGVLSSFLVFFFAAALALLVIDPAIASFSQAIWYCYAVVTTVGFGDVVVSTVLGRWITFALSAYAIIALAIVTSVMVNYYTQTLELQQKESFATLMDKLEHLPDLSPEELAEISAQVRKGRLGS